MKKVIIFLTIIFTLLIVISCSKYDYVYDFPSEGLRKVRRQDKWGFINKTGKEIIPLKYDDVDSFYDGLAKVKLNSKYGYIDKTGKEIIPIKYDSIRYFSEGLARVELYSKIGFVDNTGKEVIPVKYDDVGDFKDRVAKVKLNNKWGVIDKTGKEIVPIIYDDISDFKDGVAEVSQNNKYGSIDKTGKIVSQLKPKPKKEEVISRGPLVCWDITSTRDGYITGQVGNNGSRSYSVFISFGLYQGGAKIGETNDIISSLAPGEVWRFRAPIFLDYAKTYKLDSLTYY